jgi:hypothetical protein
VKLNFQGLDLIFRSIRVQIRIPRGQIGQTQAFAYFETRSFSTVAHACACLNNEKVVTSARVVKKHALFSPHTCLLRSCLTSNHGVPMSNLHCSVLVTKSAFTHLRKNIHFGGPRNNKCTSSTSKCLRVWAKNILASSLMMAHDGHMGQTGYRNVRHGA